MSDSLLDLFSITAPGLELVTMAELRALGASPRIESRGGVAWRGTLSDLYNANLWLRTASRVLVRVASFHAASFYELERRAKRVPWTDYVKAGEPVRFRVTCHKSALYHSDAVAERLLASAIAKGAVASVDGASRATKGNGDDDEADVEGQLFVVRLDHDMVTVSADSSGALLHKRGYRQAIAKAPLRETLGAAMLLSSGWTPELPLIDPMCGSGTLPIEAALIARRMAPGMGRDFAFSRWPGFDEASWNSIRAKAREGELQGAAAPIVASDRDEGAIKAAIANAERAGVLADLWIEQRAVSETAPAGAEAGWLITNPPYGIRVGTDVRNLYARLGALMRNQLEGWRIGMLSASSALDRQLGIPLKQVFETQNGGIKVRFVRGGIGET